jgi:hypothetical protein
VKLSCYFETNPSLVKPVAQAYPLGVEHLSPCHRITSTLQSYSFIHDITGEKEAQRRECVEV